MRAGYLKIVDHNGQPIRAHASYEAAQFGRRLSTWGTSSAGPDTSLFGSLSTLRSRSRELVRNDPLAGGGMDTLVANLIGTGITPRWLLDDAVLKKLIQELWADWVSEADADGVCDFYGLQALAARAIIEAGEVLIRFRPRRPETGLSVPLQLQLIEADHLDATYNTMAPNGNEIRMGIEFDKQGKRQAYWLFKEHPGEAFLTWGNTAERVRVPAREILHCYRPLRPGQKRGAPWLASVIIAQHEINEFDDAEIVRKKGAAMFGGFITESETERTDFPPIGRPRGPDAEGREIIALEPGTFPVLPPGMDVQFSTPADVGGGYEAFTKRQDRRVARGFGCMTYEKYTGDLTDVNYSSIRAGNLEFQRVCKMIIGNVIVFQLCRPILGRWMDQAILSRALSIPDYMENRRKYFRVKWDIDGWEWVDPEKDVKAERDAVRSGFKSRSQVVGERGHDSEAVDSEIAGDNKRADDLGNIYAGSHKIDYSPHAPLSAGDVEKVRTVANGLASDLVETIYYTGGRLGEIARYRNHTGTHPLTWDNVNFESRGVRLYARKRGEKGLKVDYMYMGGRLLRILQRQWRKRNSSSPYVFESISSKALNSNRELTLCFHSYWARTFFLLFLEDICSDPRSKEICLAR